MSVNPKIALSQSTPDMKDPRNTIGRRSAGLHPGDVTVQVFADGYEQLTQRIQLTEGKPAEQQFLLKPSLLARQNSARASVLKALASLGSIDGVAELTDIDVDGTMQWTDSDGKVQQWTVAFNKHPGRNLSATFKTSDGQCTASISAQTTKQDCKGALKNGGDKIAEQASTVFLSYQLQDVLHALVQRPVVASEADENRVESIDSASSPSASAINTAAATMRPTPSGPGGTRARAGADGPVVRRDGTAASRGGSPRARSGAASRRSRTTVPNPGTARTSPSSRNAASTRRRGGDRHAPPPGDLPRGRHPLPRRQLAALDLGPQLGGDPHGGRLRHPRLRCARLPKPDHSPSRCA